LIDAHNPLVPSRFARSCDIATARRVKPYAASPRQTALIRQNTGQPGGETADARCAYRLYIPASLAGARGPDASAELICFFDEHPAVPPMP